MIDLLPSRTASAGNDILSGLTVALALVPEAVAFAFVAGVEPLVGLYAAFMVGLITACIGGRPGMISGATGALAVVMVALVADHGVEYLFATVVLMGILQILAGVFRLGKFIRMVPHPVMLGFVNGLAIVIFLAQLSQFGVAGEPGWLDGTFMQGCILDVAWLEQSQLYMLIGLVLLTMLIINFLPKLTTAVPSSLAAILVVSLLVVFLDLDTRVVGDIASISGGLPTFHIPSVPLNFTTLAIIFPYAVILAAIGLIESLLTLRLVDEITESRGRGNKECGGQGIANTLTGMFGGMGGPMGGGMPGFSGRTQQPRYPKHAIPKDTTVYIHCLKGASQHNGKTGTIKSFNENKERYTVETDGGEERLSLKQANLTQVLSGVIVTHVESRAEFNGQTGTICGYTADAGRYIVQLKSGQSMGLVPSKVILPNGTRCVVQGLNAAAQHNGRRAIVKQYDASAGRYVVETDRGSALKVRRENVIV